MSRTSDRVLLGRIGRAQGLKGEVRITSFTQDPLAIAQYGALESEDGRRQFVLEDAVQRGDVIVARIAGVPDRTAAEALVNEGLWLPRKRLNVETAEDEFLHADLIGCTVATAEGVELGTVIDIPNYGAGDLIEVERKGADSLLIPFLKAYVPEIHVAARRIVVTLPDGLIEE